MRSVSAALVNCLSPPPRKRLHCIEDQSMRVSCPSPDCLHSTNRCWTGLPVYRRRTAYSAASVHTSRPPACTRRSGMTQRDVVFPPDARRFMSATAIPRDQGQRLPVRLGPGRQPRDGSPEPDLDEQVRLAFRNLNAVRPPPLQLRRRGRRDVFIVDPASTFERIWRIVPGSGTGAVSRPAWASPGCMGSTLNSR